MVGSQTSQGGVDVGRPDVKGPPAPVGQDFMMAALGHERHLAATAGQRTPEMFLGASIALRRVEERDAFLESGRHQAVRVGIRRSRKTRSTEGEARYDQPRATERDGRETAHDTSSSRATRTTRCSP